MIPGENPIKKEDLNLTKDTENQEETVSPEATEVAKDSAAEEVTVESSISGNKDRIETLKAEIDYYNKAVQESVVGDRLGIYENQMETVNAEVGQREKEIYELERANQLLEKAQEAEETKNGINAEIDKLKDEIDDYNKAVQEGKIGERLGIYSDQMKRVDEQVGMREDQIRALEKALRKIEGKDEPEGQTPEELEKTPEEPEEEGVGKTFMEKVKENFEKAREKGEPAGAWLKERLKGLVSFGWWEAHQAEKFRVGTKEVSKSIEGELEGLEEINEEAEDRIVSTALTSLEDKLKNNSKVQEYISFKGEKVVTPEKMAEVEAKIRERIQEMRKGATEQTEQDQTDLLKSIRESLDPKWWQRYVAGGVEAALGFASVKWVVGKLAVERGVKAGARAALETVPAESPAEITRGLQDTVWQETQRFLTEKGIEAPTNSQILEASKMVAEDSGVSVPEWGLDTGISHIKMPVGYMLKFGRLALQMGRIATL